jgi:very-short-patch-repair endonuclease
MIHGAVARGEWQLAHRGVLVLAADAEIELGRETSALLIAPAMTLTGLSVLAAHGLIPADPGRPVDVCCIGSHVRSRPGIRVHRYGDLTPQQVRIVQGLPMTTVERALLDAADELFGDALERAVDEALAAYGMSRTSRTKLRETAEAAVGRRGRAELLALADARRPSSRTKQKAAALALKLIREAGLPEPLTEQMLFGFPADFFFHEVGLVLEIDSHNFHGVIRANFNRDRRRDRVHRQHGLEVMRATYDELTETPLVFVADLAAAIARLRAAAA